MNWSRRIQDELSRLAADHRSGASELALGALNAWLALLEEIPEEALAEAAGIFSRGLSEAQPSMAPFLTLGVRINRLGERLGWRKRGLKEACRELRERLSSAARSVAESALPLLAEARTVITYSRSSTVLAALRKTAESGRRFLVVLSEARPMNEGVTAAQEMAEMGFRVRLLVDAALPEQVAGADLVMVGGDALGPGGLINKVGTRALVARAREEGVPSYALCSSDKWLPTSLEGRLFIRDNDPREVIPDPPPGVEVGNPYFDRTPLPWLTAVVHEEGTWPPGDVLRAMEGDGGPKPSHL